MIEMTNVISKLMPLTIATAMLVTLAGPLSAQTNTNTTIQEGEINTNDTYQRGRSNDNATYQEGEDNANRTRQRGKENWNETGQFGGVNYNETDQRERKNRKPKRKHRSGDDA
jgi:minor curlin subunit